MRTLSLMLALLPIALAGCANMKASRAVANLKNKPAPDFELTDLDGQKIRLSSLRGRPVVLAFWAYG